MKAGRGEAARRLGLRAERLTLWLLWARGWDLVAWRQKLGRWELDLLVSRGPELRLLEVKARRPGAWVGADTALEPEQRLRLQRALRTWLGCPEGATGIGWSLEVRIPGAPLRDATDGSVRRRPT